jgi:hypothetical protein
MWHPVRKSVGQSGLLAVGKMQQERAEIGSGDRTCPVVHRKAGALAVLRLAERHPQQLRGPLPDPNHHRPELILMHTPQYRSSYLVRLIGP